MLPTYRPHVVVLVNKLAYLFAEPKVGDAVIIHDPRSHSTILKRIAKKQNQHYFVLGDNLAGSTDSRTFGWISKQSIVGKVIHTL